MKRWMKISLGLAALLAMPVLVWAAVANVTSDWSSGDLVFRDKATNNPILTIKDGTDGVRVDTGLTDIGGGTYATADGDNDLGVAGDLEVDGAADLDGTLAVASTATITSNTTVGGTLGVTGASTFTGAVTVNNNLTTTGSLAVGGYTLVMGTAEVDNGSISDTLSATGTDSNDIVVVTLNEDTSVTSATLEHAVPGTDQVVVTLTHTAGTTTTYSYMIWQN